MILKINKVCVCVRKAVTLKSDSFSFSYSLLFLIVLVFFAHFEIQAIWRDPQRPHWCCLVMQNGAFSSLFNQSHALPVNQTHKAGKKLLFFSLHFFLN